jgi:hypothetical protein
MTWNELETGRAFGALIALAAAIAVVAATAGPAQAAGGQGTAALVFAEHGKGRTLSGQGVKVLATAPATKDGRTLSLPISGVDPNANASATSEGALVFKRGKRSVGLTGIRFNLTAGTLSGKLGDEQLDVFKLSAGASANASTGNVGLDGGKLRLTAGVADALKEELGLPRSLRRDGVGMAWLAAKANPVHEKAKAVTSGATAWGVRAAWRGYVLSPPVGSISIADGATATGPLTSPATTYGFPTTGGSYERGLYGAADKLVLDTAGSVTFAKPGHCIMEVTLADLVVTIDGAGSSIVLDSVLDVNGGAPPACAVDNPPVATPGITLAKLDPTGIAPTWSADGKTATWTAIPGTLTAAGEAAFGKGLKAGAVLDPITVVATVG